MMTFLPFPVTVDFILSPRTRLWVVNDPTTGIFIFKSITMPSASALSNSSDIFLTISSGVWAERLIPQKNTATKAAAMYLILICLFFIELANILPPIQKPKFLTQAKCKHFIRRSWNIQASIFLNKLTVRSGNLNLEILAEGQDLL